MNNKNNEELPTLGSFENEAIENTPGVSNRPKANKGRLPLILAGILAASSVTGFAGFTYYKQTTGEEFSKEQTVAPLTQAANFNLDTSESLNEKKALRQTAPASGEIVNVLTASEFNELDKKPEIKFETVELASAGDSDQLSGIESVVRKAIAEELALLRSESNMEPIGTDELKQSIADLKSDLELKIDEATLQATELNQFNYEEIAASVAKNTVKEYRDSLIAEYKLDKPSYTDEQYNQFTADRVRMQGFKVIKTSRDGTVSIVKTHSNDIIALFEGEWLKYKGASFRVEKVGFDGHLLHLGSKYFIDGEMDKLTAWTWKNKNPKAIKKAVKSPAPATKPAASSQKSEKTSNEVAVTPTARPNSVKEVPYQTTTSIITVKEVTNKKKVAKGWSVVALVGDSYLISTPEKQFVKVKQGDELKGLGKVKGIDENNNLVIGNSIIQAN